MKIEHNISERQITSLNEKSKVKFKRVIEANIIEREMEHNSKKRTLKGQAIKSIGRMPWHQEPKKDVTSCDKLRRGANIQRPADFRMGEPNRSETCYH